MLNKLQKSITSVLVETSLGIKIATFFAVVVCGGIVYKVWHNDQLNDVYTKVNEIIEVNPTSSGNGVIISWQDNADNEEGYVVRRKQDGDFLVIATLAQDQTTYTDSDITSGNTYCYDIGAYNQVGTAYSDEVCSELIASEEYSEELVDDENVDDIIDVEIVEEKAAEDTNEDITEVEDDASDNGVVYFNSISLSESRRIDITDAKYVTSESVSGNDDLSVGNVDFINYEGDATFYSRIYEFQDNGLTLAKGYTAIDWDENSAVTVNFESDDDQFVTASLYLKASAWNTTGGTINVLLNDETYPIELTSGRKWYYIRVDFEFSGEVSAVIQPVGTIGSYSKVMFAGVSMQ